MANKRDIISVLNEIARAELSGPKRHRHNWQTNQPLKRGTTILFQCANCDKTKSQYLPTIEERTAQLADKFAKRLNRYQRSTE